MSVSLKTVNVVTLFVEDLERSRRFYQDIFDLPVVFEDEESAVFQFENVMINLLTIPAARDLIRPGAVASRDSGSRFQFTVRVADTQATCQELARRGVQLLNGPVDREWGVRTASFADPGGHVWEIAQDLHPAGGS